MWAQASAYKAKVKAAFSRQAGKYDKQAALQAKAAALTADMLQDLLLKNEIADGDCLEIGCGTGFLSMHLCSILTQRRLLISDISEDMLAACRTRLGSAVDLSNAKIDFEQLDAEYAASKRKFAVIASSFALQWLWQPSEAIAALLSKLLPSGVFLFSVPGSASAPNWKAAAQRAGVPYTGNPLPDRGIFEALAEKEGLELHLESYCHKQTYASAFQMFASMKELGASTQRDGLRLSVLELRRLIREMEKESKEVTERFEIICGYLRKPH